MKVDPTMLYAELSPLEDGDYLLAVERTDVPSPPHGKFHQEGPAELCVVSGFFQSFHELKGALVRSLGRVVINIAHDRKVGSSGETYIVKPDTLRSI